MKSRDKGTMEKDSMKTETWLSKRTFFFNMLYVAQVRQMRNDNQGTTPYRQKARTRPAPATTTDNFWISRNRSWKRRPPKKTRTMGLMK